MGNAWDRQVGANGYRGSWKAPLVREKEEQLDYTKSAKRRRKAPFSELDKMSDADVLREYNKMMQRGGL